MKDFTSIDSSDLDFNSEYLFSDDESNFSSENIPNDIIDEKINDIFNLKIDPFDEYDMEDYIPEKKSSGPKKRNLFIVTDKTNQSTQLIRKKRGKPSGLNKKRTKIHDRFSIDNLLIKIKNHSLSFVVNFLNIILKILLSKEVFLQLNHEYKKNIQNFSKEKKKTLGEIIYNKISPKYHCDENWNINTYDKVKEHEIFKKILNMDYITFFRRYYMESKKCINLKDFGLENEVILSEKCKMFNDLIKKIKNSNNEDNENYINSIKKCINKNYFSKNLFKTYK